MSGIMSRLAEENGMLGPEQFGFRQGRSTIDAVFVLSTLMKKAKSKRCPFSMAFLDISKVVSLTFKFSPKLMIIRHMTLYGVKVSF